MNIDDAINKIDKAMEIVNQLKPPLNIDDVISWLEDLASDLYSQGDTYGAHIIRSSFPDLKEEFQNSGKLPDVQEKENLK